MGSYREQLRPVRPELPRPNFGVANVVAYDRESPQAEEIHSAAKRRRHPADNRNAPAKRKLNL